MTHHMREQLAVFGGRGRGGGLGSLGPAPWRLLLASAALRGDGGLPGHSFTLEAPTHLARAPSCSGRHGASENTWALPRRGDWLRVLWPLPQQCPC